MLTKRVSVCVWGGGGVGGGGSEKGRDDAFLNVLKRIPRAVTTSIIEDLKNEVR